jgi:hypothetical protein
LIFAIVFSVVIGGVVDLILIIFLYMVHLGFAAITVVYFLLSDWFWGLSPQEKSARLEKPHIKPKETSIPTDV